MKDAHSEIKVIKWTTKREIEKYNVFNQLETERGKKNYMDKQRAVEIPMMQGFENMYQTSIQMSKASFRNGLWGHYPKPVKQCES